MKKFLLFSLLLATLFSVNGQNHFIAEPRYKALVQGVPLTAVPSYEANETGESVKRTTCTDKITYLDFYGSPSSYWQVGGASAWWATGTSLNECIQVYPGYTGQVTRVDFLGGKITSNETVTIRLCSINASEVPVSVLATTTATVNSTTGEFGGAFSTPINVTNGFAVSVYLPSSTDSVNVSSAPITYAGLAWVGDGTYIYKLSTTGLGYDDDFYIRPTIQFNIGSPSAFTATPSSTCTGTSVSFTGGSAPTGIAHLNDPVFNPGGWLNPSLDFGDASTPGTSMPASHSYATTGTKTASLTWLYDGWTTDCPSNAVTQTVTVNPGPTSAFAWSSTGLSVTFTNMSTDATSYAWVFGDAGTASAPNPVHNYATSGTYTVELTATGACGSNLSFTNITITDSTNEGNIGVVEFNDDLVVNMYPNPASTQLNVDLNLKEAADVNTQIINSKGQLIYTQQNGNSNAFHLNYNTSALENGVYFLRIQYGDAVFSRPFLKQ